MLAGQVLRFSSDSAQDHRESGICIGGGPDEDAASGARGGAAMSSSRQFLPVAASVAALLVGLPFRTRSRRLSMNVAGHTPESGRRRGLGPSADARPRRRAPCGQTGSATSLLVCPPPPRMAERNDPHQGLHQYICRFPGDLARNPKKTEEPGQPAASGGHPALRARFVFRMAEVVAAGRTETASAAHQAAEGEGAKDEQPERLTPNSPAV